MESEKKRDYLLDNYKTLLIILVVVGHFIEVASDDNLVLVGLKWLIFAFHMPAFIFISGYFSKKEYHLMDLCRKLLVPYLIFEVFYYILYTYVIHKDTELYLLYPKFSLWYLMALFTWKFITPWVRKIPGHMVLAFVASLAVGASSLDDNFLTLPRMITFYPFFLLGVSFKRDWIYWLRDKVGRIEAVITAVVVNLFIIWIASYSRLSPKIFYGRYDYEYLELGVLEGIAVRILCFLIAFAMIFCLLVLLPDTKNRYTCLGSRTMAIYLFHGLVYSCFKEGSNFYNSLGNVWETLLILLASLTTVWILSRQPFVKFIGWITDIHLIQRKREE